MQALVGIWLLLIDMLEKLLDKFIAERTPLGIVGEQVPILWRDWDA